MTNKTKLTLKPSQNFNSDHKKALSQNKRIPQEGEIVMVKASAKDERIRKRSADDMIGTVFSSEKEQLIVILKDCDLWTGPWYSAWIVEEEESKSV